MSAFSSTATLLIGAAMGAVAAFLIYVGVCVIAALRARFYGPLSVTSTHGCVMISFDAGEDAESLRRIRRVARGFVGSDGVVHFAFEPERALEIARDVRAAAHRLIEAEGGSRDQTRDQEGGGG